MINTQDNSQPKFASDWFSEHIPIWNNYKTLFSNKPNMRCLEIGSFEGRSTIYTAENYCNGNGSYIDALDVWGVYPDYIKTYQRELYSHFIDNLQNHIDDKRVYPYKGPSSDSLMKIVQEVRSERKDKYDFIYIDASHIAKDVLMDAVLSWEVLKIGGIMIFDDYDWKASSHPPIIPKPAVDGFLASYSCMYKILHADYQMHIMKILDNPEDATDDCHSKATSLLYDYTMSRNIDGIKTVLAKGADINYIHPIGATALYMASQEEYLETAYTLLKAGADSKIKSKDGGSPLYISVTNNDYKMVDLLLKYNADTEGYNNYGATPLYAASYFGYNDILKLLLEHGADKTIQVNGVSSFEIALQNDHQSTAQLLAGGEAEFCQQIQNTGFEVKYIELCGETNIELSIED